MFKTAIVATLAAILAVTFAGAQSGAVCGQDTTLSGLVRCAAEAAAVLPEDKRVRLRPDMLRTAQSVGGDALETEIAGRMPQAPAKQQTDTGPYPDYGWQAAKDLIETGGIEALMEAARAKSGPLRYGRAEALLAAGQRAAGFGLDDGTARQLAAQDGLAWRLNEVLLEMARSAEAFEAGDLAHAAARLAALRCDLKTFDTARTMTLAPDAIRYTFWRARITGDRAGLPTAIMTGASSEDTRPIRQALDGIEFLAEFGACDG